MKSNSEKPITIRAAISSYLTLSGVWVVLAFANVFSAIKSPSHGWGIAAGISGCVALLWCCWLLGFKITVTKSFLEYRNGFFMLSSINVSQIKQIKVANIEWNILSRKIRVPRLIIIADSGNPVVNINPKPFKRSDLLKVVDWTKRSMGTK
jgi:hypothetical protein